MTLMDLLARGTCVPAVTARGAIVEKGQKRCKAIGDYLNNHQRTPVGAAEGCDLLILFLKTRSKDRSLRQLLQGAYFLAAGLAFTPR
jgi:hypothetical protein